MHRVLSRDLWTEIRERACASKMRKAAIAYVTTDLVGFREGDTLVVNASRRARSFHDAGRDKKATTIANHPALVQLVLSRMVRALIEVA